MKKNTSLRGLISDATAFDMGDKFESKAQVRDYFNLENLAKLCQISIDLFDFDQDDLTFWGEKVIENRWHCDF